MGVFEIGFRRFVLGIAERDRECPREVWEDLSGILGIWYRVCFVLICRLIDGPLCPTMFSCFYHETQILSWVRSI
ncbi:hypothetical protein C1H46_022058 [Malus baccata]|uniref:Uncharacterized protein n=1 Tax=Malus baccata TaxID=106549 RepID=A0A540M0S0_MALBA|nr:hypothetical protein C1H46_022058 [Malus baccata]